MGPKPSLHSIYPGLEPGTSWWQHIVQRWTSSVVRCAIQLRQQTPLMTSWKKHIIGMRIVHIWLPSYLKVQIHDLGSSSSTHTTHEPAVDAGRWKPFPTGTSQGLPLQISTSKATSMSEMSQWNSDLNRGHCSENGLVRSLSDKISRGFSVIYFSMYEDIRWTVQLRALVSTLGSMIILFWKIMVLEWFLKQFSIRTESHTSGRVRQYKLHSIRLMPI